MLLYGMTEVEVTARCEILPYLESSLFQGHCRNCLFVFVSARAERHNSKVITRTRTRRSYSALLLTASGGRQ